MFLSIAFLPIPDYILLPAFGYLSSIGLFDAYLTFLVCFIAAVLPIGYLPGRFVGRPLLLKGLAYLRISENSLDSAERRLKEHGRFSVFISTFIPFAYTVSSVAAGLLKMNVIDFMASSAAGFGIRYAILEYIGYSSIFIFTASFDYSQQAAITLVLIVSSLYALIYLMFISRSYRERAIKR
ncbi:MAG TPA: DedA family protein [Methanomassiliicoccales archaeon]